MNDIKVWKGRIQRAQGIQQKAHSLWNNSLDLYNCSYFDKIYGGTDPDRVDVHFANWYIDNLVPLVYFRDPYIFVKPKHNKYSAFADTLEKVINIYWGKLKMKEQFKRVIKSSFLMPPGWIKTGYTAKIGQDIAKLEEEKTKTLMQEIKDAITGTFKQKEEKTLEEQGVLNEYIEEESIFGTWISSWNMLIPEGYHLVKDMPYLIEKEKIARVDFLANPLYKNKTNIQYNTLAKNSYQGKTLHKPGYDGEDNETDVISLYHIEDRRNRKNITLSMESDEAHLVSDWYPAKDGFSYTPLIFDETLPSEDDSNPYPPNILLPILPQIIEQSQSRTQMAKWRKRAATYILAQRGLASEEDMDKLSETEAVQLLMVSNINAYQMASTPNPPSSIFTVDDIIKQDLQSATSMGQMMFQAQAGQRTATQAQIGQSGLQLKVSSRVDAVEDYTVVVAKKLMYMLWNFYGKDKIAELIGEPVTDEMWPPLPENPKERMRMIHSEIQTWIDAGAAAPPKDETVDRKQLLDMVSVIASIAPERLRKDEVIKALNKRFKFMKDGDKLVFTNDEQEMESAQRENELLAKNIPQVVSPNENHMLHIQVNNQAPPTEAKDMHLIEHGGFLGGPEGDTGEGKRSPTQSTNPSIMRQGQTNQGDIFQSVQNVGVGTSPESKAA